MTASIAVLGDVVEVKGGGTPSKANSSFWNGDIPWVSPKDMKCWEIEDPEDKITSAAIKESATNLVPQNSILIVNRSGILKHTLPVGITRRPVAINQDLKALICGPGAHPEYIAHIVKAAEPIVLKWVRATTADNFPIENLRSLEIPLPPVNEQRRIAAILDKADALRRKRKRAIDLLDGLTQSIFLDMFGDPLRPNCFATAQMGEVISGIDSGWSPTCLDRQASDDEFGVLKLSAVTTGEFVSSENKALPATLVPKPNTEIAIGDILMCRKNTKELVGSSAYVWEANRHLLMSDLIFRLVPNRSKIDPIFLQVQLSLASQRRQISDMAAGAAGSMPNISKAKVRELKIAVPGIRAQAKFSNIVRACRSLRVVNWDSLRAIDSLFSSLQHRAFSGQF